MSVQPDAAPLAPAAKRRRQRRADARSAILDATEAILVDEGYERFSMRKLAARCGYTAPTIYHYFGDKDGLFDTLLELRVSDLVTQLERAATQDDPVENLRSLYLCFAYFGLDNPVHYRLMTTPRPNAEPLENGERARALLEAPLAELATRGALQVEDLEVAQQSFWGLLHGLISLQHARPDVEWRDGLVDSAVDALLRGMVRAEGTS